MIPVCEPLMEGKELEYVVDCLKTNWISSRGKYIEEFEERFAEYCSSEWGISTTNGTTALHLAVASLGLGRGDEVIAPAFTMIAPIFAIVYAGAKPVLVDAEPRTWNMDVDRIEEKITEATRAIMPVHIYGHPCDMDPIMELARKYDLHVIEDAAEVHGAEYKGRKAGGIGDIGCFSFYANKIITTGEGGMVVTNDEQIAEKARLLKDLAHSRERRYLHTHLAFNYRMTNIQAAIGLAQLERIDEYAEKRRGNAQLYNSLLKDVDGITLPSEMPWARNVYWMYSILVGDEFPRRRDELMTRLEQKGIGTRSFFIPMHEQPIFKNMALFEGEVYPIAERVSREGLYLPSGSGLTREQIEYTCEVIAGISRSV